MSHYVKHPEAIFKTISRPFTDPVKWLHNVGETLYDSNPFIAGTKLVSDTIGNFSPKGKEIFRMPTYDELGKPGQAFADRIDAKNSILPASWRPYAQPLESLALSVFNPFAGAAFNTAYQGGKQQQENKGFDWGRLGKDAAINFGTAGLQAGANQLISNANNAASAAKNAATLSNFNTGLGATNSVTNAGVNAANAARQGALSAFNNPGAIANTSFSAIPSAVAVNSSGAGDVAYKAAVNTGKEVGSQAIAATLAPPQQQPIAGVMNNFQPVDKGSTRPTLQWGDLLNAFGGSGLDKPNPNGYRIGDSDINDMTIRLGANNYLQQQQAKDKALPAGQFQAWQNTPYANRLNEIQAGSDQSIQDLLKEADNYNNYYRVIDANQGLTNDQLDAYIKDPTTGVLGDFQVPQDQWDYFRNLRPLGPQTTSLIH